MEGSIKNFTKILHHKRLYLSPPRIGVTGPFDKAWEMVKKSEAAMFVDDVRGLVMQGYQVMDAVRQVSRIAGVNGSELMRAYVEAYR